jgi:hypothetical protein
MLMEKHEIEADLMSAHSFQAVVVKHPSSGRAFIAGCVPCPVNDGYGVVPWI